MKRDREGKMNTMEKQCIVHVCSRPAIEGTSQSVTLLIRISFLTSKTFSSLYTFRLPVTADTKEFGLARSFLPDPQKEIDQFAIPFKFVPQPTASVSPEMLQETLVTIYVKKVSQILEVFIGVGEEDVCNHLRHYALECVPDTQLRDRIMERLYSSPPSTRIQ
jgi:hypothetical protein